MIRNFINFIIFLINITSGVCNIDSTNINHGDMSDSINNLLNAINTLRNFKIENIFATNNIFDKYYLRSEDVVDDLENYMQQLKLPQQRLSKSHKNAALKTILRDGSNSDEEENDESNNKEDNRENKNKNNLRYFDCEYGRSQCVKACKEAYREVCDIEECERSLRRRLRKYCKRFCALWFY